MDEARVCVRGREILEAITCDQLHAARITWEERDMTVIVLCRVMLKFRVLFHVADLPIGRCICQEARRIWPRPCRLVS